MHNPRPGTTVHARWSPFLQYCQSVSRTVKPLILRCPHCGSARADELECLNPGRPDIIRCENPGCSMSFVFLLHECSACAEESVFTWKEKPSSAALAQLVCQHCAEPVNEAANEAEGEDPTQRI